MTTSVVSRLGKAPEEGIKAPVVAASTGPLTLNGTGQTIDGVLTSTGQRVLVKDQALPAENGIYLVGPNDWERATDMNADNDVTNGQLVVDANRSILYQISVTSPWDPGATPINFLFYSGGMPPSITLTLSDPIDLVDTTVALKTGAADPDTEPHLEYDFNTIQSKADATTVADLLLQRLGGTVISGDPGFEAGGILINGVSYNAVHKFSEIGSTYLAQMILHKHSSLYPPYFVAARAQGDTSAHVPLNDTDIIFGLLCVGWGGSDYIPAAEMRVTVNGTPGDNDMPGQWEWYTTPDNSDNVILRMTLDSAGNLTLTNAGIVQDFRFSDTAAGNDDGKWGMRLDGLEFTLAAFDDAWAISAEFIKAERASGTGLINALAIGSSEVDQIDFSAATILNFDVDAGGETMSWDGSNLALGAGTVQGVDVTAIVSNATHTGDAAGATALTLQAAAITGKTVAGALAGANQVLLEQGGSLFRVDLATLDAFWSGGGGGGSSITYETPVVLTGQTGGAFTSLPIGIDYFRFTIEGAYFSVTQNLEITFGGATSYDSHCMRIRSDLTGNVDASLVEFNSTTEFAINLQSSGSLSRVSGVVHGTRRDGNEWLIEANLWQPASAGIQYLGRCELVLSSDLTSIGIGGALASTFTGGEIGLSYGAPTPPASSAFVALGETDVTGQNTFDFTGWPADVKGFRINFRDLRHANSDMTVRLRDSGLVTTGYDSHVTRVASGGARTFTTSTGDFEIDSGNFDYLLRGYIEGTLMDETADRWSIVGKIFDEDNNDTIHIYGEVDLGSDIEGLRLQSAAVTNFTSGFFSIQYWT